MYRLLHYTLLMSCSLYKPSAPFINYIVLQRLPHVVFMCIAFFMWLSVQVIIKHITGTCFLSSRPRNLRFKSNRIKHFNTTISYLANNVAIFNFSCDVVVQMSHLLNCNFGNHVNGKRSIYLHYLLWKNFMGVILRDTFISKMVFIHKKCGKSNSYIIKYYNE